MVASNLNLTSEGGMQFPNIRKIEIALKRIYKSCEGLAAFPNMYGLKTAYVNTVMFI